jgi:curved DNA-binding protein CbpA
VTAPDPFTALGLTPSASLTDRQVRDAWRAVAVAAHPDRPDGGDPARYARAETAYTELRTPWGRTEALADLRDAAPPGYGPPPLPATAGTAGMILNALGIFPRRVRHGRPLRITIRAAVAAVIAWGAVTFAAGTPAAPAIPAGCALWFILTSRHDLAPPPGR